MRTVVSEMSEEGISERKACEAARVSRNTIRHEQKEEDPINRWLRVRLRELSAKHRTYGTPFMKAIVCKESGLKLNHKRVERIWGEECLPVPRKRRRRLKVHPLTDRPGAAQRPFQTWSLDFIHHKTEYGQKLKMLSVIDDFSKTCIEVRVEKRFRAIEVIEALDELFWEYGKPEYIRTDNGPEFISELLHRWTEEKGVKLIHINPGSPWENGYVESFHDKLRRECLNGELFFSRGEAQVVVDWWREHYNNERPHSTLGYIAPSEFLRKDNWDMVDRNGLQNRH